MYKKKRGNSLVVQWLGLHAFTASGSNLMPGRGTKIPQAMHSGEKERRKGIPDRWNSAGPSRTVSLTEIWLRRERRWEEGWESKHGIVGGVWDMRKPQRYLSLGTDSSVGDGGPYEIKRGSRDSGGPWTPVSEGLLPLRRLEQITRGKQCLCC